MKNLLLALLFLPMFGFGQQCISGNCVNGQGTYTWASGNKYVGEWMNDMMHGQGTYTGASGDKYVGEWQSGKRHGQGTFTYANANAPTQKGLWKNGEFVGE